MELSDGLPVGEEGKDFLTLPIVVNSENPGIWDIYLSHRGYYALDREPVKIWVDGRGVFTNQLELYVHSISYYEKKPGALLLLGQIRRDDLDESRFFEVEVFYTPHDLALSRGGHLRVYLGEDEGEGVVTPPILASSVENSLD